MKLLDHEELELMIVKVLETEKGLPKGYELVHLYDPTSVAKLTMYSMAHRIRDLEAEVDELRKPWKGFNLDTEEGRAAFHKFQEGLDLQGWVDMNVNRNTVR